MNIHLINKCTILFGMAFVICSCSTAKLEARLEANPQCRDVVNTKTGALMPCPGSDKAFYREVGLAPAKSVPTIPAAATSSQAISSAAPTAQPSSSNEMSAVGSPSKPPVVPVECKPQIHKKTGGTLPCPAAD